MFRKTALLLCLAVTATGQIAPKDPILDPLPQASRSAYPAAFKAYVDAQVQGEWNALYALSTPVLRQEQSEDGFVAQMKASPKLTKFTPERFEKSFANDVVFAGTMYGCAEYSYGGQTHEWLSTLPSSFARGRWWFAPIHPFVHPNSSKPLRCDQEYPNDSTKAPVRSTT